MKPYGMNKTEYTNSKKAGDYKNSDRGTAVYSAIGARNGLRRYKKAARRAGKAACIEGLEG